MNIGTEGEAFVAEPIDLPAVKEEQEERREEVEVALDTERVAVPARQ